MIENWTDSSVIKFRNDRVLLKIVKWHVSIKILWSDKTLLRIWEMIKFYQKNFSDGEALDLAREKTN